MDSEWKGTNEEAEKRRMVKKCCVLMRVEDSSAKDSGSEYKHIAIIDSALIFRRNSAY